MIHPRTSTCHHLPERNTGRYGMYICCLAAADMRRRLQSVFQKRVPAYHVCAGFQKEDINNGGGR